MTSWTKGPNGENIVFMTDEDLKMSDKNRPIKIDDAGIVSFAEDGTHTPISRPPKEKLFVMGSIESMQIFPRGLTLYDKLLIEEVLEYFGCRLEVFTEVK